ncbi:MAG TPA: ribokinase [Thermomonospora sp.]|nr:ribokinase [Thermomonospora sp.]
MSEPVNLLVVGSLNMDLSVGVARLPVPGETVLGDEAVRSPGGKGANQAVAARRLGARVRMAGLVGDDLFGTELREALAGDGVEVTGVRTAEGVATGIAMIIVRPDGENVIAVASGANARLAPATAEAAVTEEVTALLLQLEIPVDACLAAAGRARGLGRPVVLNAAPAPPVVDGDLARLLRAVDLLVVNEAEAAALSGPGAAEGLPPAGGWEAVAAGLRRLGPAEVVVTLGSEGAAAATAEGTFQVSAFPMAAIDRVGAGDAFSAQLTLARAEGRPLTEAVRRACAAGALATTRRGAQTSLPTRAEVEALLSGTPGTG